MAQMKKASILINKNQIEEGLAIYLDLEKTAVDQSFKDISTILYVLNAMNHEPPELLLEKIERLTKDNAWMFSALELKGFIFMRSKQFIKAKEVFEEIIKKNNAPATLSGRARDMLEYLKGI